MRSKLSKNFYWWLVCVIALIGLLVYAVFNQLFFSGMMFFALLVALVNYLKYRKRGE